MIALLLFLFPFAHALSPAQLSSQVIWYSGSDNMDLKTLRVGYTSPETESSVRTYGATVEAAKGSLVMNAMEAVKASGTMDYRLGKNYVVTLTGGAIEIQNDATNVLRTIPYYSINPRYEHGDTKIGFTVAHDGVYQEWVEPGVIDPFVTEQKFEVTYEGPVIGKLKTRSSYNYLFLSDTNERHSGDGVLLYPISEGRLNLSAGPGIFYIGFSKQVPDYWSPREFADYTARFEATYKISDIYDAYAAAHVGPATDLHSKDGLDVYYEAHLAYTGVHGVRFELDWDELKAYRPQFRWTRNDWAFNVTGQF